MLPFFKKYAVIVCVIAVALPVVYTTVYAALTGNIAASSPNGLVTMFTLFIAGLLLGFGIFERRAQAKADGWVSFYNDSCDPEAFLENGAALASSMSAPYTQASSWYMGYFAQASLDVGNAQDAKEICSSLRKSVEVAKKPFDKLGILVNAIPVIEKIDGNQAALDFIDEGLKYADACKPQNSAQYREFLAHQQEILLSRSSEDNNKRIATDATVWQSSRYPKRIRTEYAWDGACAAYLANDVLEERKSLEFVVENGNKLALVSKAKTRLESL